jgi:transposase
VERCQAGDRTIGQVARDFDLVESAVRRWVEQAEIDAGRREGVTSVEREELSRLRRENARLQADVDLLKRAMGFMQSRGLCGPGGGVVGMAVGGWPF